MARRSGGPNTVVSYALVGLGSYIFYSFSIQGKFGSDIQAAMLNLRSTLKKGFRDAGGGGGGNLPPGKYPVGDDGTPMGFIRGVRYVQDNGNGTYTVVFPGQPAVIKSNLSEAERLYNSYFV